MAATKPRAILFDLDGTLIDTAPDLVGTANRMLLRRGLAARPFAELRPFATAGAAGILKAAFNMDSQHPEWLTARAEFFADYESHIVDQTVVYAGVPELLQALTKRGIVWGIVTNKVEQLTFALLRQIDLAQPACVVCGDTMSAPKPSALPMLEAAQRVQCAPQDCWYVGDDPRDGLAAAAAHMPFVAVDYGYGTVAALAATMRIQAPLDLLRFLARDALNNS